MNLVTENIKDLIIEKAKALGFVSVGFSKADLLEEESARLKKWLSNGYAADMNWIEKGFDKRKDVKLILENSKSVISLAYNYYTPVEHDQSKPKISRYAWGKDYHKTLKKKLRELSEYINEIAASAVGGLAIRSYVDDGPVMDKAWAVRSGIGWMGKHTNVINPEFGSWLFLCEIITNLEFENYDTPITDLCGGCKLCIQACPTGAIVEEYKVDANLCISYQTIENRGEIPKSINLDGWLFGCDVCQDVCPYNSPKYNQDCRDENFYPKEELFGDGVWKTKSDLEQIKEDEFNKIFADSPIKRTKFKGWKRNINPIPDKS